MPTYKMTIAYDGTAYCGWQYQPGKPTIQGVLVETATRLNAGETAQVEGAGRTDAGVHARGQVAGVVMSRIWEPTILLRAFNGNLPSDIAVRTCEPVDDGFDARREALWRHYQYNLVMERDPLVARYAWEITDPISVSAMQDAAMPLLGTHDFATFSASMEDPEKSTIRQMYAIRVGACGKMIRVSLVANAYLPHMVRYIVWMLVDAGKGRIDGVTADEMLKARDRNLLKGMAPPSGLILEEVHYGCERCPDCRSLNYDV